MRTVLPNVFVIGAAKSGTTSLVAKLAQHPDVFVPATKEPFYFSFPDVKPSWTGPGDPNEMPVYKWNDYLALYASAASKRVRIDGSTSYLYDEKVPARVAAAVPDAKIIVMLRHPIDRAYSAFLHIRRRTTEESVDFSAALEKEDERIKAGYEHLWHYRAMSRYSAQLKRWFGVIAPEQIKVCLYDDLVDQPDKLFAEICLWLGLDAGLLLTKETRENVSSVPRNVALKRLLLSENVIKTAVARILPQSWRKAVWKLNTHKPGCPVALRERLTCEFADDICQVQALIARDLSHWLSRQADPLS